MDSLPMYLRNRFLLPTIFSSNILLINIKSASSYTIDFFRLALYRKRLVCQGVPSKNAENPSCRSWQGVFCFLPLTHGCVSDGFIGAERKRQTEHRFPKREFYRTVFGFVWLIFDKLWFILYFIRVTHLPYWEPPAVCYEQRWRITLSCSESE